MQTYQPECINNKWCMILDNMPVDGIDKLYVDSSVEKVRLVINGQVLSLVSPNADGEVIFWKDWSLHKIQSFGIVIEFITSELIEPTVQYREAQTNVEPAGIQAVFLNGQDWIPTRYQNTPYNNELVWRDRMMTVRHAH